MRVHVWVWVWVSVSVCVSMCVNLSACVCICMSACARVCVCLHACACVCVCTYVHVCVCIPEDGVVLVDDGGLVVLEEPRAVPDEGAARVVAAHVVLRVLAAGDAAQWAGERRPLFADAQGPQR